MIRLCVICGARVRNINKKVTVCSSQCGEIKKNGATLDEMVRKDSQIPDEDGKIIYRCASHGWASPVSFTQAKKFIYD